MTAVSNQEVIVKSFDPVRARTTMAGLKKAMEREGGFEICVKLIDEIVKEFEIEIAYRERNS
jgi:hypothetical protein